MINLLPFSNSEVRRPISQLFQKVKEFLILKKVKFLLAIIIDLILIAAVVISGKQPAKSLISPIVSSFDSVYSETKRKITRETFAFVPNLSSKKFPKIDLQGLTHLAFFDVPLTEDGGINHSSKGYKSFTSSEALLLFDRARFQKTKILLTLSAMDERIIKKLLDNSGAQEKLADGVIEEIISSSINGITIDFEFPNGGGKNYQERFTNFISFITSRIHKSLPEAEVTVAVPSSRVDNQSLYNVEALSKKADKLFLIASDFIVPETKQEIPTNPVYGFSENEYFTSISNLLNNLQKRTPVDKLVLERAWYGNGQNYPLYVPDKNLQEERGRKPSPISIDEKTVEKLIAGVPKKGKNAARTSIPLIAKALDGEGILDSNVLAYALATIEHETDKTFEPIAEIQGNISARRRGYEGGSNYFGRGFIQITHLRNYREIGKRIGLGEDLVKNPELASNPEIAAKILAAFFKDNNVANLASKGKFVAARAPINPDYNGYSVALLANKYDIY